MQTTIACANTCMPNAQQRQKHFYDKRYHPSVFNVRAEVLLATMYLYLRTAGMRKLIPRRFGPKKNGLHEQHRLQFGFARLHASG